MPLKMAELEGLELSRLLHPAAFKAAALPLDYNSILAEGMRLERIRLLHPQISNLLVYH